MHLDEFQQKAEFTALYPDKGNNFVYPALGLAGESGEVCEKIKKVLRDKGGNMDNETREALLKELGDVLWYVARLASELGLSLDDIAQANLDKLASRHTRGVLGGSGDNR